MANALMSSFKEKIGADDMDIHNYPVGYPTGVDALDFLSMSLQRDAEGKEHLTCGIYGGKVTGFIGYTGTGKSSFEKMATGGALLNCIMSGMENKVSSLFMDLEGLVEVSRCFNVSPFDSYKLFSDHFMRLGKAEELTTEKMYNNIARLSTIKKTAPKEFMIDHPYIKGLKLFVPTFISMDPTSRITTEDIVDDVDDDGNAKKKVTGNSADMGSNTEYMRIANKTKMMMGRVRPLVEGRNMPLTFVSHISVKANLDPYAPKTPFLPGMRVGEKLDNGKAFSDVAYHIYKIDHGKQDKDHQWGGDFRGANKRITVSKSKSCGETTNVPVYFDFSRGIVNIFSNFYLLNECKKLIGSGHYSIPGYDKKFTKKTLYEKYHSDATFKDAFDRISYETYLEVIHPSSGISVDDVLEYFAKYRPVGEYGNKLTQTLKSTEPEAKK